MSKELEISKIAIFDDKEIRKGVIADEWVFSVIDVVAALTDSSDPTNYWSMLKKRELEHGIQLSTFCGQLKLTSKDGKKRITDVANTESLFRIIQSIPSRKAEPFKLWLARVGKERLDEIEQPAKAIVRAKNYYSIKGYTLDWIQTRTASIDARHQFTDVLKESGIKEDKEYAILTNEIYKSTFDLNAQEYKNFKELKKSDSLRDNMTPLELAATIFSEATSTEIIKKTNAKGFTEDKAAIQKAGYITKEAIKKIEKETKTKVITKGNYKHLDTLEKRKELAQKSLPESENNLEE